MNLNLQQKEAINQTKGPVMVIAGAGTGKTTVLTERVKKIITDGLAQPSEILALTFTEKAAREMEERIDIALPMGYVQTWIMTFHQFGEQILRHNALAIGLDPGFELFSEAETQLFLQKRLGAFDLDYFKPKGNPLKFVRGLTQHFSRLKDEDIAPSYYLEWVQKQLTEAQLNDEEKQKFQELAYAYETYENLKHQEGVMDFGDLISNTLRLFRERPDVLKHYQNQFKYILVDEYQDTNYAQTEIVHVLASAHRNIAVFLDDDQSIYRFRGAAVYNAMAFRESFPEAQVVVLTENYRSTQQILDFSYTLITHNNPDRLEVREHIQKRLHAAIGTGPMPSIIFTDRGEDEADAVAKEIQKLVRGSSIRHPERDSGSKQVIPAEYQWKDIAILVRANNHAEIFTKALARQGIPYQFLGPGRLYNQPEIKDLIAYFRVLVNFKDDVALYRLLVKDFFHIDRRDIAALVHWSKQHTRSLFESLELIEEAHETISGESIRTFTWLRDMLLRHIGLIPDTSPGQLLYYLLEDTKLLDLYKTVETERQQQEVQNISKFFDQLRAFELKQPEATVYDWVEYQEFMWDQGESPIASEIDWTTENAVHILTIHSAKGLEFPVVFMINVVSDRFPTRHRHDQIPIPDALAKEPLPEKDVHAQEERRLFYVGMTRAKDLLYLSGAKFYGDAKRPKKLSPFIYEAFGEDISSFMHLTDATDKTLPLFSWGNTNSKEEEPVQLQKHTVSYLSYSQIDAFKICPLHYKLKYILNVPTPVTGALTFGTSMHNVLRAFYQWWIAEKEKKHTAKQLQKKIDDYFNQYWIPIGYVSEDERKKNYALGKRWLRDFVANQFDPTEKIIDLERAFTIKLTHDLKLTGRIDRISQLADGRYEIIDYKTGTPRTKEDLASDLQLAIYALAASDPNVYNKPVEELSLAYYYFENQEKVCVDLTPVQLDLAKKEILKMREEIEKNSFKCSNSFICTNKCEYDLFCNRGE